MFIFANILQPLIDLTETIMKFFHDDIGLSWGFSIMALTIVVRMALLPLTLRQSKSMQKLAGLQPQMKLLQQKYKGDKQRLNQEMMKFYQSNKVNPLGSCLPLVAQLPVFLSLFYMLRKDLKLDICPGIGEYAARIGKSVSDVTCSQFSANPPPVNPDAGAEQFFFIPDLTSSATGTVLIVLLVMYVGSQLVSSLLMTVTADKNQRRLMAALPFVFTIFIINFPAGLLVYWITTNCWTIVQQYIVRTPESGGLMDRLKRAATPGGLAAGGASGAGKGGKEAQAGASGDVVSDKGSKSGSEKGEGATKAGDTPAAKSPPPPSRKTKKRSGRRR
ncbi:MAG: YidC/Oxa1 family membrane protein insertase [Solirubrobacterales bacterium]|nr:YidC/Oxa1 family membrane protein insertase [Solirubrobacterales bacterium]